LLATSQACDLTQRLTELATSQRWCNDVLHLSWIDQCIENFKKKFRMRSNIEKIKKTRFFMSLKLRSHLYLLHFTNYVIYWLMISLRSIFKWQQNVIKRKAFITTIIRRIRYSIFITRLFAQTTFRTTKKFFEFVVQ
jgi:hypothetical protein